MIDENNYSLENVVSAWVVSVSLPYNIANLGSIEPLFILLWCFLLFLVYLLESIYLLQNLKGRILYSISRRLLLPFYFKVSTNKHFKVLILYIYLPSK